MAAEDESVVHNNMRHKKRWYNAKLIASGRLLFYDGEADMYTELKFYDWSIRIPPQSIVGKKMSAGVRYMNINPSCIAT